MGRLFDAVASLLGLCDQSSYEGEAACYLEALASTYLKNVKPWMIHPDFSLHWLVAKIVQELAKGTAKNEIAWQFHQALVRWIEGVATMQQANSIAFSGGVFQNALLADLICSNLSSRFDLYFHQQLSPNDECIGFGQLACHQIDTMEFQHDTIVAAVEKEVYAMI